MKVYDYLFYRIYTWLVKKNGPNEYPGITTVLFLMGLGALNSYLIILTIKILVILTFSYQFSLMNRIEMLLIGLTVFVLLYFRYIYNQKYKSIISIFEDKELNKRKQYLLLSVVYIVLSLLLPVLLSKSFKTIL
jgi:Ca2+/Na+ antiporter